LRQETRKLLTKDERSLLDKKIDHGIPATLDFKALPNALLHLLRAAEHRTIFNDARIYDELGSASAGPASDVTRESLHWSVLWAHYSLKPASLTTLETTDSDLREALSVLQLAADYSEMCDIMTVSWLDGVEIEDLGNGDYSLCMNDLLIAFEAAQWLWRTKQFVEPPAPRAALEQLEHWLNMSETRPNLDERVVFDLPSEILFGIQDGMRPYAERLWQLSEPFDLKIFSTADFRPFWLAVMAAAVIPRILFNKTRRISVSVPITSKSEWVSLLSALSGLNDGKTETILSFMIYSARTAVKKKNQHSADVISQPFLYLDSDRLALSSCLALGSSAERNLFDLASNKIPKIYDGLKKQKEHQWSAHLASKFQAAGRHALFQKDYPGGDIDLFVFDSTQKVALVVQLKWFLVDRIKSTHLQQANDGVNQAQAAIDWIKENTKHANDLLGVTQNDLRNCEFLPLVVLKEGILNGFARNDDVPILSSEIFDHSIDATRADLQKIWRDAQLMRFLPLRDYHYIVQQHQFVPVSSIPFNGVRFKKHVIRQKEPWIPWTNLA
jgi:hypothetical protein